MRISRPSRPRCSATRTTISSRFHRAVDSTGAAFSGLCAIHCLALPFLLAIPSMSLALLSYHHAAHGLAIALLHLSRWEWVFAVSATFIALASTLPALVERRRHLPGLLAATGGALLIAATTVPWLRDAIWPHSVMSVCGGSLLVAAHLRNRRAPCLPATPDRLGQMRDQ